MMMDLQIKIPQDIILEVAGKLNSLKCFRREIVFELQGEKWKYHEICNGYGNGYGLGVNCKENCKLRINDILKMENIELEHGSYWIQPEFYGERI